MILKERERNKIPAPAVMDKGFPGILFLIASSVYLYGQRAERPWERIDSIQVPHHGSQQNFSDKLYYRGMTAFISCGEKNKYGHPGKEALNFIIRKCDRTHLVTENPQTYFCEEVRFIV